MTTNKRIKRKGRGVDRRLLWNWKLKKKELIYLPIPLLLMFCIFFPYVVDFIIHPSLRIGCALLASVAFLLFMAWHRLRPQ